MGLSTQEISRLQSDPACIRNICIVAHVDHGKTSLSDSLLATNGIISQRLAGKVRYLDSRPDEQLRGITMESSAISLYFRLLRRNAEDPEAEPQVKEHLINLIDSPGHIDFSSEVSTASRLCDGAVVLVDVVEGVCSQTVTVLRQAWVDGLKLVLVLNKIDRLITELKLSSTEAYIHLNKVIEQVNSVIGSFFAGERMQEDLLWRERKEQGTVEEFVEKDDEDIYFAPEKNNVIFASAYDGWGFNIAQFASIYEKKLGMKRQNLQKVLWGNFYLDPKSKKVISSKGLKGRTLKPLFVSLVLDNIWAAYDCISINRDQEKLEKVVKSLSLKVNPRDLRSKDSKTLINTVMSQWLPVSSAVLVTVVDKLPSPLNSQKERIPTILEAAPGSELIDLQLKEDMLTCNQSGLVSAYVSKMVSIPESELPKNQRVAMTQDELFERGRLAREAAAKASEQARLLTENKSDKNEVSPSDVETKNPFELELEYEDDEESEEEIELVKEALVGVARVYSGSIKVGQELTVLGPKFNPANPNEHVSKVTITDLYLIMGRELISLAEVPAGNLAGIGGLAGKVLKSGTLVSSEITGVNLAGLILSSAPIVRVALEPVNPTKMDQLVHGLELLNQADPCVRTFVKDTGEYILATAGELHLERCLKDLRERFAGIEITSSQPEIPYRETILAQSEMNPPKKPELGRGVTQLSLGNVNIKYKVIPLPEAVVQFLSENHNSIKNLVTKKEVSESEDDEDDDDAGVIESNNRVLTAGELKSQLQKLLETGNKLKNKDNINWTDLVDRIVSLGPKRMGPNILMDLSDNLGRRVFGEAATRFQFEDSIINGFQLAMHEGPLAAEPIQGVAVIVQEANVSEEESTVPNLSGRTITTTRDCIHQGFLDWSPRLMLAMYSSEIQASAEVLGKVYAVIQRRRGHIDSEEMKEGTPFFSIEAKIPVVEAFGFSEDIRKKTSGAASPQLVFSGFEIIDMDPFWVPTTEEELEDLGETADKENVARKYMNAIRKRKGLFVDEKVVKNAEKQRTLKKD
ncbi:unnamed protein product [Kuraishia capsulata CBS 1993]|uniref:Ribosome assembly protein 1 n=1 Tax=Kuraishia capsulata CBS 1993 TaxID=1382522 RepID=W6MMC1_9ASCO|nr:uncharacterized protein KUCA_T00003708001 [Kuraishia capsulata CBS 1993]CDK27729.1 unnamed protein product [Kuraishia capsulata CBS 1993]